MNAEPKRTILVTGAARGLGLALTHHFFENDWRVVPLIRSEKDLRLLPSAESGDCLPILADVADDSVQSKIVDGLRPLGALEVLVNNAGIQGTHPTLVGTSSDEVSRVFEVHCLGALRVTRAAIPFIRPGGSVVNVSSRLGSLGKVSTGELDDQRCSYAYRIAKAAQNMLTQCLAREYEASGVKIFSIHPGQLSTGSGPCDANHTPDEAAERLLGRLSTLEHGGFYDLFGGRLPF